MITSFNKALEPRKIKLKKVDANKTYSINKKWK